MSILEPQSSYIPVRISQMNQKPSKETEMSRQQAKTMREKMKTAFDSPFKTKENSSIYIKNNNNNNHSARYQEHFTAGKSVISRHPNGDLNMIDDTQYSEMMANADHTQLTHVV